MSAEFEKLATRLRFRGYDVAAGHTLGLSKYLRKRDLIPDSLGRKNGVANGGLPEQLRQYRTRPNFELSQRGLAEKTGVDHATISKIEAGKVGSPSMHTLVRLIDGLKLDNEQALEFLKSATKDSCNNGSESTVREVFPNTSED